MCCHELPVALLHAGTGTGPRDTSHTAGFRSAVMQTAIAEHMWGVVAAASDALTCSVLLSV